MMEKIIEPKSYKKMVENYTHPVHVYGKKINLKEGVGAGYDLTFLGIKLTNVKVEEPQKDRDGVYTARFTADIVPGEYDFCADHPYWSLGSLLPDMSGTRAARGWKKYFVDIDNCMDEAAYITGGKVEGVCDDGGQRFTSWNSDDNGPGWTEEDYIREIESEEFILGDIYGGGYAHSPLRTEIEFEYSEGNSYFHAIDQTEGDYNDATILKATFNFDPDWVADYNDAVDRAIYGDDEEEEEDYYDEEDEEDNEEDWINLVPEHESKKSGNHRLQEGPGAGYSIIFKDIELENIKVTESDENIGDKNFHFEADIKPGEYDWYAEGYDWNTGTDWCGEQVKVSGKVTGAYYYYDYNGYDFDAEDAEHEIAKEKYDLGDLYYSGGWSHADVPEHFVLDEDVDLSDERSGYKEAFVQYAELDIDADTVNAFIEDIMYNYEEDEFEESKIRESEDIRQNYLKAIHDFLDPKLPQKKREEASEDADFYLQMLSNDNPILRGKSRLQVACWCKTGKFKESNSKKLNEYTVKEWFKDNPYPAAYDKADPLDRYYAIQVKEVNPEYRRYFHHTANVGDYWAGSAFTFVDEFSDAELYETPKKAEEALKEVNDAMDRLAKFKKFNGRPYEFEIVGGHKNVVLDESKIKENWEKDCSDYYDAHHDDKWYNLSDDEKAEYYNNWLEGTLNESKLNESADDWEDDREDYEGTVADDLAEMRYLVDKEKSGMSLDSYELRVLQSLIRDYPDEYEEYLNNDYVDPEDYDKEGTYEEYLRYCAVTNGDPMSEEEWRKTTGIYESKLKEDALSSKIRQSVLEVNAAKQKVDQDVDVLDRVVNKASQDMMRAAINHGKTSQMTESGTSFVHKSIKVDFPLDFDKEEVVREEDARRLLRKIAAERKLRVNTEYKIEDSYGYTSTWEFNETDDPGFRYVFSCKDGDYSCSLYLNKRRNKVDLKNSKFVRDIDRKEEILVESKLNEAARYTHRIELAQDDPSVPLRTRITNADQLRYRSQEEAEKALNDLNKRWGNGLSSRGLHLEIKEIPQKPRRVASQVEGYENPFEVGDILEGDFGYNMTLPVWYEVVKVTSKQVTLKELSSIVVSHDGYGQAGIKRPNVGVYKKDWEGKEKEIRALVKKHNGWWNNRHQNPKENYYVVVNNHILDLWDGKDAEFDTYD